VLVVHEGYLTKRAIVSGRNWKRRYFVIYSDGQIAYKIKPEDPSKKSLQLSGKSNALVLKELAGEGGFCIEGPTHDALFLKAESVQEAKVWIKKVNDVAKMLLTAESQKRNNTLDVFARGGGKAAPAGKGSGVLGGVSGRSLGSHRAGAKEKRTLPPPEGGWPMRVGEGKTAKDVFVDANTWMYYADKSEFDKGGKVLGKADLAALI